MEVDDNESIMNARLDTELRILLLCSRTELGSDQVVELERLVAEGPNWERLLDLAGFHRLIPFLYWNFKRCIPDGVPANVRDRLAAGFLRNQQRVMGLTAELLRLADRMKGEGVPYLPFKGPVLASTAYGNVALRPTGDLDILVKPADAPAALAILKECGYYVVIEGATGAVADARQERAVGRFHYNYNLFNHENGITVELHTRLLPVKLPLGPGPEEAIAGASVCRLAGREVLTLNFYENLVFLCVHGAKHAWDRLEWIVALAESIRRTDEVDEEKLLRVARKREAEVALLLGVLLAVRLLGLPGMPRVQRETEEYPVVEDLFEEVVNRLDYHRRVESERQAERRFQEGLCHSFRSRLRWSFYSQFQPGRNDFRWMPWTFSWTVSYYVIRQVRLLYRRLRRWLKYVYQFVTGARGVPKTGR